MSEYIPTIGLEIHAELNTKTKMFCCSKNDQDEERPNVNICPVCLGHPGTLPVINKQAVQQVLRVGLAVGGTIADYTEFDRKNYFYPDIPKGYQISQYKYPLISGGTINDVELTRIHLEEDTARSTHDTGDYSLVDFNRAGLPLMELVTEPVMHSPEEAGAFARELRLILRYLGASEANMEKGQMRVEVNLSLAKKGEPLGTKVEVKNINSFRAAERAAEYEIKRQTDLLRKGEPVVQETRGWDENKQQTFSQRKKEQSHDYRYFPDPDLPKLKLSEIPEFSKEALEKEMPELPHEIRDRYTRVYEIANDTAELLVSEQQLGTFFNEVAQLCAEDTKLIKLAGNYLTSDVMGQVKDGTFDLTTLATRSPKEFKKLIDLIAEGTVSSRGAKDTLKIWLRDGGDPEKIATDNNLIQNSDSGALEGIVAGILKEHAGVVDDYKGGKETALKFLVGQGMKASKGSANPQMLESLLKEKIG